MLSSLLLPLALVSVAHAASLRIRPRSANITALPESLTGNSFDYVIAGGGLTGLSVASRLTEDPNITVLVIEAGQDNHLDQRVFDVRTYGAAFGSKLDHNLTSTPVASQNGSRLQLVAGHTLGGSGSINGASWTKGASSQYDILPLLNGDDSWGWEPFNQKMLLAENFYSPSQELTNNKSLQYQAGFHGQGGPVQVSFAQGIFESIQVPALEASEKVWFNLSRSADMAAGVVNGATIIPNMIRPDAQQSRSSPYTAYTMVQDQDRDNLVILTGHRVIEIVWQNCTGMAADGVKLQASANSDVHFIKAKREVLLAAGSLQSPQLLELSGVGDARVLQAAGVPVKLAISGVGKHMQEQTKNSLYYTPKSLDFGGTGPSTAISFPNVHQVLGDNSSATYDWITATLPAYAAELEAQGLVANGNATLDILQAQVDNLFEDDAAAAEIFFTISTATGEVGIDLWNLIVLSRGTVHIQSANAWKHPRVDPQYFLHPFDLMIQTAATRQSREVYQTEPLASYVTNEIVPGLDRVPQDAGDDVWEGFVRESFTSVWHYIATLSMMKEELGGVVDSDFKVYGIENVRVIDASVLPIQLSAHLSSSLYGIAEKAAIAIKKDQA